MATGSQNCRWESSEIISCLAASPWFSGHADLGEAGLAQKPYVWGGGYAPHKAEKFESQ